MRADGRRVVLLVGGAFAVAAIISLWIAREPTVPLSAETLRAARQLWKQAALRDYDLSFFMHASRYDVQVRDGIVRDLRVNGQMTTSGDWGLFSMDGLFDTLAMELDNRHSGEGPFAAGREVSLRARFHPAQGYVERFLRGGTRGASIELISLTPATQVQDAPPAP